MQFSLRATGAVRGLARRGSVLRRRGGTARLKRQGRPRPEAARPSGPNVGSCQLCLLRSFDFWCVCVSIWFSKMHFLHLKLFTGQTPRRGKRGPSQARPPRDDGEIHGQGRPRGLRFFFKTFVLFCSRDGLEREVGKDQASLARNFSERTRQKFANICKNTRSKWSMQKLNLENVANSAKPQFEPRAARPSALR